VITSDNPRTSWIVVEESTDGCDSILPCKKWFVKATHH
jgi:hypothetical protein